MGQLKNKEMKQQHTILYISLGRQAGQAGGLNESWQLELEGRSAPSMAIGNMAQKIWQSLDMWFLRYVCGEKYRYTDIQTDARKQTHWSQYSAPLPRSNWHSYNKEWRVCMLAGVCLDVENVWRGATVWDSVRQWTIEQGLRRHLLLPSSGEQHAGVLRRRQDRYLYAFALRLTSPPITLVTECCKDDDIMLWRMRDDLTAATQNRLTDHQQNLHKWLLCGPYHSVKFHPDQISGCVMFSAAI